jgi:Uma2 family endonuclease
MEAEQMKSTRCLAMSSSQAIERPVPPNGIVIQLENGERADQKTFHAWYKTTRDGFKAELIGGEVVVASPLKVNHSEHHGLVMFWLWSYTLETPGTRPRDNATAILGEESEPQPDAALIIEPACGGQTAIDEEGYATGAPEFVGEIANSSGAIDLHRKKQDYERAGVKEYAVVLLRNQQVRWFVLRGGAFQDVPPGGDGIYRSVVFPGLWLDAAALLRLDSAGVAAALRLGLASPEHAAFVQELAARAKG